MAKQPRSNKREEREQAPFPPSQRQGFLSKLPNPLGLFSKKSKPQNDVTPEDLETLDQWEEAWDENPVDDPSLNKTQWDDDGDDYDDSRTDKLSAVEEEAYNQLQSGRPRRQGVHKATQTSAKATQLLINVLVVMILLLVGMAVFVFYTLLQSDEKALTHKPAISRETASHLSSDLESRLGAYGGRASSSSTPSEQGLASDVPQALPQEFDLGYTTQKDDIIRSADNVSEETDTPPSLNGNISSLKVEKPTQASGNPLNKDSFADLWGRGQPEFSTAKSTGQSLWRENAAVTPVGIEGKAQIAIILDDDPASKNDTVALVSTLNFPVTVGVYSSVIGEQSVIDAVRKDRKHDVILNIPMEDKNSVNVGYEPILNDLSNDEMKRRMNWHLDQLTGYIGVKNHLGGALTSNTQSVAQALNYPAKRGLLFVDMRIIPESIASSVATKIGMPSLERDVWLSPPAGSANLDIDPVKLSKNLDLLEKKAKRYGFSVGIGVATPQVVSALKEWSERVSDKEVVFVPLSTMMKAKESLGQ